MTDFELLLRFARDSIFADIADDYIRAEGWRLNDRQHPLREFWGTCDWDGHRKVIDALPDDEIIARIRERYGV